MRALLDALPLTAPDEVMRRGFANQTEKALLLLALLRRSEIEAAVGLVSGSFRAKIREFLPSSDVVDDEMVQVCLGKSPETTHWLRSSCQRSTWTVIASVPFPTYGSALVLHPGTNNLTPFQPPSESLPVKKVSRKLSRSDAGRGCRAGNDVRIPRTGQLIALVGSFARTSVKKSKKRIWNITLACSRT